MEFVNGKHLANYLLKIFKNNGIDVPSEDAVLDNLYKKNREVIICNHQLSQPLQED